MGRVVLEEMVEGDLGNLGVEVRIGRVENEVLEEMVEGDLGNLGVANLEVGNLKGEIRLDVNVL